MGTDLGAFAAGHTGRRLLVLRQKFGHHGGVRGGLEFQVVIHGNQHRNVQPHGTSVAAVPAAGAGDGVFHVVGDGEGKGLFLLRERTAGLKGRQIVPHLVRIGHPAEHHFHIRQPLQEPEAPGRGRVVRIHGLPLFLCIGRQIGQLSAPDRLHHPDGNVPPGQQLILFLCLLEGPVQIVQLNLAELHVVAADIQTTVQQLHPPVAGKAQMADAALLFLLPEIVQNVPAGV